MGASQSGKRCEHACNTMVSFIMGVIQLQEMTAFATPKSRGGNGGMGINMGVCCCCSGLLLDITSSSTVTTTITTTTTCNITTTTCTNILTTIKMSSQSSQPSLPRLVRTTHTPSGTSIFLPETNPAPFFPFGPSASGFTVLDTRASIPVTNTDAIPSFAETLPRCPPQGAIFCMSEIKPGAAVPMHRTQSIDYVVVLGGEISLRLDGGEETVLRKGDLLVQQGVNHAWENKGDVPCTMLFVLLGAEKVVTEDGTVLEETAFKKGPPAS